MEKVVSTVRKQYMVSRMVYWYDQRSWYPDKGPGEPEDKE
jgi:hypothetical protein